LSAIRNEIEIMCWVLSVLSSFIPFFRLLSLKRSGKIGKLKKIHATNFIYRKEFPRAYQSLATLELGSLKVILYLRNKKIIMTVDYWHEFTSGRTYHLYNHSVSNDNIFNSDFDYQDFLDRYKKYIHPYVDTYAFCLMPNHFHLLFKVKSYDAILKASKSDPSQSRLKLLESEDYVNDFILNQWKRMLSSYVLAYNNRHNRRGQLFLKRMKRVSINEDERLSYLIAYIHHNPIHHRFTKDYGSWKYSSYKVYRENIRNTNLFVDYILQWFEGREKMMDYHEKFKVLTWDDNLD